jgi:NRAMP (natural resistance-associated macrophage protein)-like metal ion transporter
VANDPGAGRRSRWITGGDDGHGARAAYLLRLLAFIGPGVVVMLADTDAGSVVTAAQSGARYGYQLVLPQVAMIPILYSVQEITARLGLVTGRGQSALIRSAFGARWALPAAATLFVACAGAMITEFAGVVGVGELAGVPRWVSTTAAVATLTLLVLAGRYRRVEFIGIVLGALELAFVAAAILARPHAGAVVHGLTSPIQADRAYLTLLAANVGSTVIPWMVYYQQGAVADKGRRGLPLQEALRVARADTALGAVVCQLVTIAIITAVAATVHSGGGAQVGLSSIGDIAAALRPVVGRAAVILFGVGMIGAALLAALVISLAGAWSIAESMGWHHSLNDSPRQALGFYGLAVAGLGIGAVPVLFFPNLVALTIDIEVLNACLLPIVLAFLVALERRALPEELRLRGLRRGATYLGIGAVIGFGIYTGVRTLVGR